MVFWHPKGVKFHRLRTVSLETSQCVSVWHLSCRMWLEQCFLGSPGVWSPGVWSPGVQLCVARADSWLSLQGLKSVAISYISIYWVLNIFMPPPVRMLLCLNKPLLLWCQFLEPTEFNVGVHGHQGGAMDIGNLSTATTADSGTFLNVKRACSVCGFFHKDSRIQQARRLS